MRHEYSTKPACRLRARMVPAVSLAAAVVLALPANHAVAGGGGGGSKASLVVRIKNTSTGPTAGAEAPPLVTIDTVPVGDPGNSAIYAGGLPRGTVDAEFRIATREVTLVQYATFLSAVAKTKDGHNAAIVDTLYDPRMATDANIAGIIRTGSGTAADPYLYSVAGDPAKPVTYVSWYNAVRFANWLHNGGTAGADTETGAYTLGGEDPPELTRNDGAVWWLPNDNEWFKAAYYKGGGTDAGYWKFPTRSDQLPGNSSSTEPNQANFKRNGIFSVTQSGTQSSVDNYLTAVGTFANSPGPYGTFDQGGNVDEWTEENTTTSFGVERITRGGAWSTGGLNFDVNPPSTALPGDRINKLGFRLARGPLPPAGPGLSGDFEVTVGQKKSRINAGAVQSFAVRKGNFIVTASDAANPSVQTTGTFSTGESRNTFLLLSGTSGVISITRAPAGQTF